MNPYGYVISLRIEHPSMDPAELTERLGRAPESAWKVGEPRATPRGRPLRGTRAQTYWTVKLVDRKGSEPSLAAALAGVAHDLEPHAGLLHQVRNEGGRAELFVGWFFDGNSGDEFPVELLSTLGRLGLDLSLDVYPPDGDSNGPA